MKTYIILFCSLFLIIVILNCNLNQSVLEKEISWVEEYPNIRSGATSIDIILELSRSASVYYIVSKNQLPSFDGNSIKNEIENHQSLYDRAANLTDVSTATIEIKGLDDNRDYFIYLAVENEKSEIINDLTLQFSCELEQRLTPISYDPAVAPFGYYQYLPEDYYKYPYIEYPVIVFLHGIYHRGNGLYSSEVIDDTLYQLPRVLTTIEGRTGGLAADLVTTDYPAVVIVPQCPVGLYWQYDDLDLMIDFVINNYNIDPKRVYLTGLSLGGGATWVYALDHSDKIAAIVPICGYEDVTEGGRIDRLDSLVNMPVWAFHNEDDSQLSVDLTYGWVNGIKGLLEPGDTEPLITIYETGEGINAHDAWTRAYHDPDLFNWLFDQRK